MKSSLIAVVVLALVSASAMAQEGAGADAAAQQQKLAKQSQNPVANMISVPVELWHYDGDQGEAFSAIVKPMIPVSLGKLNLINRFILPYMDVSGTLQIPGLDIDRQTVDADGLADFTYQGFLSPARPGKLIWGAGAALVAPTATDDQLSTDLWSIGPSGLALTMPGNWVLGLLVQNVWSFAGSGDQDVNKLTLQPIINYTLAKGWYLSSVPVITANWEADDDEVWTVPVGGGAGKVMQFGKQPVDLKLVYYSYVEKPTVGPNWSLLFSVKLLFPQ